MNRLILFTLICPPNNCKLLNFFLTPVKSQRETYAILYELYIEFVHRTLDIVITHVKTGDMETSCPCISLVSG